MRWLRFAVLLLPLCVTGCGRATDNEQLRLCRLVPRGAASRRHRHPRNSCGAGPARPLGRAHRLRGARAGHAQPGAFRRLRVRRHHVRARPARSGGGRNRRGRLGEARLLYLKRFLAQAEREGGAPPSSQQNLPQLPAAAAYALQQLVNAIALAAVYALLATAYSLIYGLVGRINLAFGEIAVLGAYGAIGGVAAAVALGVGDAIAGLALAFVLAAAISAGWSLLIGRVVVAPLHARHRLGQPILIATAAVALSVQEFLRISQGARERWTPPVFNQPIALGARGGFHRHRHADADRGGHPRARGGVRRAAAAWEDALRPRVARLRRRSRHGGAVRRRRQAAARVTFLLAGLLAGLTGWIVAAYYGNISFSMGAMLGLKALVAAVVGGIGSVPGAFLGGVCVALIEAIWSAYFDITARDIVVFSLLIVVFVLRPGGLLGFAGPKARDV